MTYTLTFMVLRDGIKHTLTTDIAGCVDEDDAKRKLETLYTGIWKVRSVSAKKVRANAKGPDL